MNEDSVYAVCCPQCGAPFSKREGTCDYCGAFVARVRGPKLPPDPPYQNSLGIATYGSITTGALSTGSCTTFFGTTAWPPEDYTPLSVIAHRHEEELPRILRRDDFIGQLARKVYFTYANG